MRIENYTQLWKWSVTEQQDFWSTVWEYTKIIASEPASEILDTSARLDQVPEWFRGARLNFAENLLWCTSVDKIAIIATGTLVSEERPCSRDILNNACNAGEGHKERRTYTYKQLYDQVRRCAAAMKAMGIKKDDRVAAYIPNCAEAIIAMLATTSLGAIWR